MPWQPTGTPPSTQPPLAAAVKPVAGRKAPQAASPPPLPTGPLLPPAPSAPLPVAQPLPPLPPSRPSSPRRPAKPPPTSRTAPPPTSDRKRQAAGGASPRRATEANPSEALRLGVSRGASGGERRRPVAARPSGRLDRPDFLAVGRTIVRLAGGGEQAASLMGICDRQASPGPVVVGPEDSVFLHAADGCLHCIDGASGKQKRPPAYVGEPLGCAAPVVDREGNAWISARGGRNPQGRRPRPRTGAAPILPLAAAVRFRRRPRGRRPLHPRRERLPVRRRNRGPAGRESLEPRRRSGICRLASRRRARRDRRRPLGCRRT